MLIPGARELQLSDLLLVGLAVVLFAGARIYVAICERL